jgi:hypothetical protein
MKAGLFKQVVGCLVVFVLAAPNAHAWSNEAHRITALIAEDILSPKARAAVSDLLDGGNLADASTFMDLYREALKRELPGSDKWHYDNPSVCAPANSSQAYSEYCPDGNCASAQVSRWFNVLADTKNLKEQRALALRLLIHIVGDLHQPMHAANDDDLGGAKKIMQMPAAKLPQNLHLVWDVDLPKIAMRGLTEQLVAKDLLNNHKGKFPDWLKGDALLWVSQSYGIARRLAYGKLPGFSCGEIDGKPVGLRDGKPWTDEPVPVPRDYIEGAIGIIPILLAQSGARIGGMLNAALDPEGIARAQKAPATAPPKDPPKPPPTTSLREALGR